MTSAKKVAIAFFGVVGLALLSISIYEGAFRMEYFVFFLGGVATVALAIGGIKETSCEPRYYKDKGVDGMGPQA